MACFKSRGKSVSFLLALSASWYGCTPTTPGPAPPRPKANTTAPAEDSATVEVPDGEPSETATSRLTIGDPAPMVKIGQWIKGDPVSSFEPGHVYVVEFWATWCGPCRASMPHLSKLQTEHAGKVTFIGVSDEDEPTVRDFLGQVQDQDSGQTWDEILTYRIALDDAQATSKAYMQAAGQNGIPTAFVVGQDGHVEWIGHPMRIDQPLTEIVAGGWDRQAARAEFQAEQAQEEAMQQLSQLARQAQQSGDWSEVLAAIDRMVADQPAADFLPKMKLSILMMAGRFDEAYPLAEQVGEKAWDDPQALNELAWRLMEQIPQPQQKPGVSLRLAQRASSLTEERDASILDTLARAHYVMGNLEEAIAWQSKAVERAEGEMADQLRDTLEQYRSAQTADESPGPAAESGDDAPAEDSSPDDSPEPPADPADEQPAGSDREAAPAETDAAPTTDGQAEPSL